VRTGESDAAEVKTDRKSQRSRAKPRVEGNMTFKGKGEERLITRKFFMHGDRPARKPKKETVPWSENPGKKKSVVEEDAKLGKSRT